MARAAIVSASGLRRCGWGRVLKSRKPRSRNADYAAGRGTTFHGSVERWKNDGAPPSDLEDQEIQGWVDLLAANWAPSPSMHLEMAVGLGVNFEYVEVVEVAPHVYLPKSMGVTSEMWAAAGDDKRAEWLATAATILLTAGRADVIDVQGRWLDLLDWKTGVYPPEQPSTSLQLWGLAGAAARKFKSALVRVGYYYPRDGAFDRTSWVVVGGREWDERMADVEQAAMVGDRPVPGANCIGCWERRECEYAVPG
jgi:hypothetical protein